MSNVHTYKNRFNYNLKIACRLYGFLVYHYNFWDECNDNLLVSWNGIGKEGDWFNFLIPRTAWGLNIELASLQHDYDWIHSDGGEEDFHISNLYFLHNMNQIVRYYSTGVMWGLRQARTNKYYLAVETDTAWDNYLQVSRNGR